MHREKKTLWLSPACEGSNTYYVNYQGDAAAIRPSTHLEMWWGNKHFPLDDYRYGVADDASSSTELTALA